MKPELRRKNILTAWLMAGFALFFFITSFPFWKGMFTLVSGGGQ